MAKRPAASKQRKTGIDSGGVPISHGCWCGGDVLSVQEAWNMGDPISYQKILGRTPDQGFRLLSGHTAQVQCAEPGHTSQLAWLH